jgi:glycerophosphoryl diester phosphodiesterase
MIKFELVAHRGYPSCYPENSLLGMQAALEAGARYVEFDVHFSRDAVPVVVHDANLRRVTGRNAAVYRLDYADIARLPAGEPTRFGERYRHLPIPRLEEMLDLIATFPEVTAFVEVKRASLWKVGRDAAMQALRPLLNVRRDRLVLLSFDRKLVAMARDEGFRTGWAFEPWRAHHRAQAVKLQPEFLFTSLLGLPPGTEAFWPGPWKWAVYDVPDLAQANLLAGFGANLIETDWIGEWLRKTED